MVDNRPLAGVRIKSGKRSANRSNQVRICAKLKTESAKNLLKDKALTHLLITDLIDVEYLSGFRSSNALILISKENLLFSGFQI